MTDEKLSEATHRCCTKDHPCRQHACIEQLIEARDEALTAFRGAEEASTQRQRCLDERTAERDELQAQLEEATEHQAKELLAAAAARIEDAKQHVAVVAERDELIAMLRPLMGVPESMKTIERVRNYIDLATSRREAQSLSIRIEELAKQLEEAKAEIEIDDKPIAYKLNDKAKDCAEPVGAKPVGFRLEHPVNMRDPDDDTKPAWDIAHTLHDTEVMVSDGTSFCQRLSWTELPRALQDIRTATVHRLLKSGVISTGDSVRFMAAAERLIFCMSIYEGYTVENRGPRGCLFDALETLVPAIAQELQSGDSAGDVHEKWWPEEDDDPVDGGTSSCCFEDCTEDTWAVIKGQPFCQYHTAENALDGLDTVEARAVLANSRHAAKADANQEGKG